ncbi:hypothetical protein CHS0354_018576 [Potamilus streckersoni]|uniref:Uncharacterized protein n=1 Tax=Potamilus streckersoni TaxID=2493646 RepID=A0AAE0TAT8_9BIVA|nr:hypothetical protein CHS0354_018576 [Potamilus streckersoni]
MNNSGWSVRVSDSSIYYNPYREKFITDEYFFSLSETHRNSHIDDYECEYSTTLLYPPPAGKMVYSVLIFRAEKNGTVKNYVAVGGSKEDYEQNMLTVPEFFARVPAGAEVLGYRYMYAEDDSHWVWSEAGSPGTPKREKVITDEYFLSLSETLRMLQIQHDGGYGECGFTPSLYPSPPGKMVYSVLIFRAEKNGIVKNYVAVGGSKEDYEQNMLTVPEFSARVPAGAEVLGHRYRYAEDDSHWVWSEAGPPGTPKRYSSGLLLTAEIKDNSTGTPEFVWTVGER